MNSRTILAVCVLILSALACGQYVGTPTPASTPTAAPASPTAPATLPPSPAPSATATEADADTAIVRQPVVRVRNAADGDPTGDYILAGQRVTVLAIDGDWVQIAEPPGWVYIGCLEGLSEKGCEADE